MVHVFSRCVLCCTSAVLRTAVVRGGRVDRFVGVSMGSWEVLFYYFSPRYTSPSLAWFGVPLV